MWTTVDRYLESAVIGADTTLDEALSANAAAGLPAIDVSPLHGKLLNVLASSVGAKRVLEIGTLGGYSTIWLASAVGDGGYVLSLEVSAKHAEVARSNLHRAGFGSRAEVRVGAALDSLAKLIDEKAAPFDFIFIDADKPNIPNYFRESLKLSHAGTMIVCDNVVREGKVADASSTDANVLGVRTFFESLNDEKRVTTTVVQTVGRKGHDGMSISLVTRD
jgi:predicted O-methyltransferase YrrM